MDETKEKFVKLMKKYEQETIDSLSPQLKKMVEEGKISLRNAVTLHEVADMFPDPPEKE